MPELKEIASQLRRDIVRMVHGASSGHPGGSLGCADFFAALYFKIMKHNPAFNMDATGEDVFVLSNGHISPVFYSALARSGYFDIKELATFRKLNPHTHTHIHTHTCAQIADAGRQSRTSTWAVVTAWYRSMSGSSTSATPPMAVRV